MALISNSKAGKSHPVLYLTSCIHALQGDKTKANKSKQGPIYLYQGPAIGPHLTALLLHKTSLIGVQIPSPPWGEPEPQGGIKGYVHMRTFTDWYGGLDIEAENPPDKYPQFQYLAPYMWSTWGAEYICTHYSIYCNLCLLWLRGFSLCLGRVFLWGLYQVGWQNHFAINMQFFKGVHPTQIQGALQPNILSSKSLNSIQTPWFLQYSFGVLHG